MVARKMLVLRRAENNARVLEVVERLGSAERVERLQHPAEPEFLVSEQVRALAEIVEELEAKLGNLPNTKGKK